MTWTARIALACAGAMALAAPAQAQSGFDSTVSLRADAWSGDRRLDDDGAVASTSAWASARYDAGAAGRVVGSGWLRAQSDGQARRARLRELYWRGDLGPLDVRVGRQIIAWGRADGVNPTDNLSPRDFTLLVPEDGDARHGNDAVSASGAVAAGTLTAIWFPHAASHTIPLLPFAGVNYVVESAPHQHQWATKWEGSTDGVDGSVSYFDGTDPMPTLLPGALSAQGFQVRVHNERFRVVGADLSLASGSVIWRMEGALTRTDSTGEADFNHKKPQLWLVGGGEWQLGEGNTLGVQATLQHVFDFGSPDLLPAGPLRELAWRQLATSAQTSRDQGGVIWRAARRAMNDNLVAELSGIAVWPSKSGLVRAKLSYALSDHVQVLAGVDSYFGPERSFFGQLHANRLAYVQLRYGL